jgi:fructose-1,6-bisphosphatase/inositol monophosphatase family enzyme
MWLWLNSYFHGMPDSRNAHLKYAVEAALRAGRFLSASVPASAAHIGRDVKLDSDRLAENIILESLGGELAILTEESGLHGAVTLLRWIVDPLDGSMNFLRGVPFCCVSIGLWQGMQPVLGVIYDFNRNEIFTGIVGEGAWLNDDPIHVSVFGKEKGILCTGLPVSTDFSSGALAQFIDEAQVYKKVRLLGSAALSLAYIAAGRVDAYRERDIKIWDVAAGIAIVQAAGGFVTMTPSHVENAFDVYASNEKP